MSRHLPPQRQHHLLDHHLVPHNGLYRQALFCGSQNTGWTRAGEEKSPVHYSKRNIKCGNFDVIWTKCDKATSLIGATTREEKRRGGDGFTASCDLRPIACLSSDSLLMAIGKDLNPLFCAFLKINTLASIWLNAHPLCWNEARWVLSFWSMSVFFVCLFVFF